MDQTTSVVFLLAAAAVAIVLGGIRSCYRLVPRCEQLLFED